MVYGGQLGEGKSMDNYGRPGMHTVRMRGLPFSATDDDLKKVCGRTRSLRIIAFLVLRGLTAPVGDGNRIRSGWSSVGCCASILSNACRS
jgi:hypothetical protein